MTKGFLQELKLKKERKRRIKTFSVFFAPSAFISLLIYAFLFSGAFKIENMVISINPDNRDDIKNISSGMINNYLESRILSIIERKNNIFFFNKDKLSAELLNNIYPVSEVNILKNIFKNSSLNIDISLREEIGIWCVPPHSYESSGNGKGFACFKFDENGFLFEEDNLKDDFLVRDLRRINISKGDYAVEKDFIDSIIESKKIIDFLNPFQIEEFLIPEYSAGEFWIETKEGWLVYLDKSVDIKTQIVALKKLLEEKIGIEKRDALEYIDLRIDDRMYYRLKYPPEADPPPAGKI